MTTISKFLSPIKVTLDQLLLDPNNPRFSELGEALNSIPEARFAEEKIQSSTKEKMKSSIFDVSELKDTIKTVGFLPMDRIVLRKWKGALADNRDRYVVIEGNRRATALKWLIDLHENGKETFSAEQIENFTNLDALILDDKMAPETATLILPGLRHVSGVKEWGAYQKAKAVHSLRKAGLSPQDAAQSLGLSTRAANTSFRCFLALEQMRADEEFGEYATPKMYSYFEEILKRPDVKLWLNWSDEGEQFVNQERLKEFYGWMVPSDEDDENGSPKLPEAKSVRDLGIIVKDEQALNVFRSPDGTLSRALAKYEVDHPEDWYPKVLAAANAIQGLTPDILRKMNEQSTNALVDLATKINQALKDREALIATVTK
jgi:hypothetical protein